jgi:serine/threonine-protein kinase RsbW
VATVTVSFTPLPAHVRTARFVAASVARRAGVAEGLLDEVRLAVSEACSLAVRLHRRHAPAVPVELRLTDEAKRFRIQVADAVARGKPADDLDAAIDLSDDDATASVGELAVALGPDDDAGPVDLRARERIGLAVIVGLVDDVEVEYLASGTVVTMTWPITQEVPGDAYPGGTNLF